MTPVYRTRYRSPDGGGRAMDILDDIAEELDRPYLIELGRLQVELVKLQRHVQKEGHRLVVIFEGRDAAGKGGTISRLMQFLDPRSARVVALQKPTKRERGQWYFQRWVQHLPTRGEMAFLDRSWYTRAVVEPALGFCTEDQYARFLETVVPFEKLLVDDGIILLKFWLSISPRVQAQRLAAREHSPLRSWKLSPTDRVAHERFELLTRYKAAMFARSHTVEAPWYIVRGDDKKRARLAVLRQVLALVDYPDRGSEGLDLVPDPEICAPWSPTSP